MLVHLIHSVAGQSTPHLFVSLCLILPESRKVADPVQDSRMQIRACMQVQIESGECNLASASKVLQKSCRRCLMNWPTCRLLIKNLKQLLIYCAHFKHVQMHPKSRHVRLVCFSCSRTFTWSPMSTKHDVCCISKSTITTLRIGPPLI